MRYWFTGWRLAIWIFLLLIVLVTVASNTLSADVVSRGGAPSNLPPRSAAPHSLADEGGKAW
jgi:hypothetical protein